MHDILSQVPECCGVDCGIPGATFDLYICVPVEDPTQRKRGTTRREFAFKRAVSLFQMLMPTTTNSACT